MNIRMPRFRSSRQPSREVKFSSSSSSTSPSLDPFQEALLAARVEEEGRSSSEGAAATRSVTLDINNDDDDENDDDDFDEIGFSYNGGMEMEDLDADVVSALRQIQLESDERAQNRRIGAASAGAGGGNNNNNASAAVLGVGVGAAALRPGRRRDRLAVVGRPSTSKFPKVGGGGGLAKSLRRPALASSNFQDDYISPQIMNLELAIKAQDWLVSFRRLDPRYQILHFFNDLALDGVEVFEKRNNRTSDGWKVPKILRGFTRSGIFSVWRPTSNDAIRKMITGEGTGKGLDIKGKSAKRGAFSGYVPFLQIHDNEHKSKVGSMRADKRVRVFYPNKSSRDAASTKLNSLGKSMTLRANSAWQIVEMEDIRRKNSLLGNVNDYDGLRDIDLPLEEIELCHMDDPRTHDIDTYAGAGVYGLDISEKLFWHGYVALNDISRAPGSEYDTGRTSMPEFQDMNNDTLRNWSEKSGTTPNPRPVLWHGGCGSANEDESSASDPMSPLGLLMAYEDNGMVIPVVSDFDCFLLGTRGVKYHEPLGELELTALSKCVDEIGGILETPKEGDWTQRWLEVKKKHAAHNHKSSHEMPPFGYADPRSYKIMTGAVHRLRSNGAVRHGPECFNYGFPQDLDDKYLVVSDTFPGVPWRYANSEELIGILCEKIDEGFTFPLNPKWILCDPGWKAVYDKMLASQKANVQDSMRIWYPQHIRERISEISTKFPGGFVNPGKLANDIGQSNGVKTDLAQLELRRYMVRMSTKNKITRAFSSYSVLSHITLEGIDHDMEVPEDDDMSVRNTRRDSYVALRTRSSNRNLFFAAVANAQNNRRKTYSQTSLRSKKERNMLLAAVEVVQDAKHTNSGEGATNLSAAEETNIVGGAESCSYRRLVSYMKTPDNEISTAAHAVQNSGDESRNLGLRERASIGRNCQSHSYMRLLSLMTEPDNETKGEEVIELAKEQNAPKPRISLKSKKKGSRSMLLAAVQVVQDSKKST